MGLYDFNLWKDKTYLDDTYLIWNTDDFLKSMYNIAWSAFANSLHMFPDIVLNIQKHVVVFSSREVVIMVKAFYQKADF